MQNKLQELTDKLYNEGLSKGKQEAESLLAKAKEEASKIVEAAEQKAAQIVADARKEADELQSRVSNDIGMASRQTISALRQQVEGMVAAKAIGTPVKEALADKEFIKELICTVANRFAEGNGGDLDVILPEKSKESLGKFIESSIGTVLAEGTSISYSKNLTDGFRIVPKDGGYFISFAGDDFEKLFAEYLRPATRKILFG